MAILIYIALKRHFANTYIVQRMKPTTQKQASKRTEIEVRRHKALELKIAGHSDRDIARILDVDVSTAHRDVKNVLEALAKKYNGGAERIRALLNERYEDLFRAYYGKAMDGDKEATKLVTTILERVAKINGVIPDKSLITVDQRAMKFDEPVTFKIESASGRLGIDELARVIQENDRYVTDASPEGE